MFKKAIGSLIYFFLKNISFHFLLPPKYSIFFEKLRTYSLVLQGAKIGKNTVVRKNVFIAFPRNLNLGENVTIGFSSRFYNYSMITVDDNSELGPCLHIQTNDHIWEQITKPIGKQGTFSKEVRIGKGVFIGANVTILQGVIIEDLSVIASGSVVNKRIFQGFLYGGVPAKKIKALSPKRND